jgi:hypothetical protein
MYQVKSPILFLIFNRPKESQILFNAIREAKPKKLYVAADGPRNNGKDELVCKETKNILNQIDWDCELITLFREENLGCGKAVSSAVTWFFENEEEGIILEDDCLPSPDFFRFCDLMLEKYRVDNRIGHICGCNFQDGIKRGNGDYYYSNLTNVWGWASWRRVWLQYDFNMTYLEEANENEFISKITNKKNIQEFIYKTFVNTKKGLIDTWDYQYFYSNLVNGFLSVIPNNNMITNIGFNSEATHTIDLNSPYANMKVNPLQNEILSPLTLVPIREADEYSLAKQSPSIVVLYYWSFKQFFKRLLLRK